MRSSVFQYPYDKVLRRTKGVLTRLGMKIIETDEQTGNIIAESGFSFMRPAVKINLVVEQMENQNTRVTVTGFKMKKHFFQKDKNLETSEAEILEALSSMF
jgi:hypothetical protein